MDKEISVVSLSEQIKTILIEGRLNAIKEVNSQILKTYWEIGRIIVEHEQSGSIKAEYGKRLLNEL